MSTVNANRFIVTAQDRAAVESLLKGASPQAKIVDELPVIDGFVVEAPADINLNLFKDAQPGVNITPDRKLHWIQPVDVKPAPNGIFKLDVGSKALGMEEVWSKGFTGKGVGVAILDSGTYPHKDFEGRLVFKDFIDPTQDGKPHDEVGHGTHTAGDAAGSGAASKGRYKAPAFEATILGLRVGDDQGPNMSDAVKAIGWAIDNKEKYNIRVMSMSFGGPEDAPPDKDPVEIAIKKAYDNGIVSVVAAGNEGPTPQTVGSPGNSPYALTIGAFDDQRTITRDDDVLADFSSRGPTPEGLTKPDVLAPGVDIFAPRAGTTTGYVAESGTSMATPIAAGVLTTWFQADPHLTPQQAIDIARSTAIPLKQDGLTANDQGQGEMDAAGGLNKVLAATA